MVILVDLSHACLCLLQVRTCTSKNNNSLKPSNSNTQPAQSNKTTPNICWSLEELHEKLTHAIARDMKKWKASSKIGVARQWADEIGVSSSDKKGDRTKAKAANMIGDWQNTYEWSMQTGNGDIERDGRKVTFLEQRQDGLLGKIARIDRLVGLVQCLG